MASFISDIFINLDPLLGSLTVLFPGFLSYFVYVGLRTHDFEKIKRSHVVLILFFTLFFQIVSELSGGLTNNSIYMGFYFFVFPILLGIASDVGHRLFVSVGTDFYQKRVVNRSDALKLVDVGNVTRWQKTVREYVEEGLGDITKEYYTEIELKTENGSSAVKKGFLNGYSDDDVEIIRYDDLSNKEFENVGDPDINEDELTLTVEIIPYDKISTLRIYRIKMEDFRLE